MQRLDYGELETQIAGLPPAGLAVFLQHELPQRLSDMWCAAYISFCPEAEIVTVELDSFSYLFDLTTERNIAAYGVMRGKQARSRDRSRMAGFPKAEGKDYHRGHLIPHGGHGGTDINLFIQLGSVNVGPFRELEKRAVARPGSFYFVRLLYTTASQRPNFVEQGLLTDAPAKLEVRLFPNGA
jgi:hypothetical protein